MSNLLDVCNRALLNIGERPIVNTANTLGSRVRNVVSEAFAEVQTLYDWSWLCKTIQASSWVGNSATIPNVQRIKSVYYRPVSTYGLEKITYLSTEEFNYYAPQVLSGNSSPKFYTTDGSDKILLLPYPNTLDTQANLFLDVVLWLDIPSTDDGLFVGVPEQYINLVVKRASGMLAVRQLGDAGLASSFNNEFEVLAQRLRDRNRGGEVNSNMYRFGKRRYGR